MFFVSCSIPERFVNPLFEVFDGGDLILSSYRDIEEDFTRMRIYFEDDAQTDVAEVALRSAMEIVGVEAQIERGEIADEDWKLAYRRHFKIEEIGKRLVTVPAWEKIPDGKRIPIVLDPGMAFGTGKHETTKACLEFIDELSPVESFLDMGTGSGILAIAASKLGCSRVCGFDVDQEAVEAAMENAKQNQVAIDIHRFALGRADKADVKAFEGKFDLVVANILGPLLIRFADEIVPYCSDKLIISGILNNLYTDVLKEYISRGFRELAHRTIGEWTTGLLSC